MTIMVGLVIVMRHAARVHTTVNVAWVVATCVNMDSNISSI
jgi:hypothetical protein